MAHSTFRRSFLRIAPLVLIGTLCHTSALASETLAGLAVRFDAALPAEVDITAYSTQEELDRTAECPVFKQRLGATTSSAKTGAFSISLPEEAPPSVIATACGSEYFPREITAVRSHANLFSPYPLKMYPRDQRDSDQYGLVGSLFVSFISDLDYLRSINPEAFNSAIERLESDLPEEGADAERALIEALRQMLNKE